MHASTVRSVVVAPDGAVWAAGYGGLGGLRPDGSSAVFTEKDGLPDHAVESLWVDPEKRVWVTALIGFAAWERGRWRYPVLSQPGGENLVVPFGRFLTTKAGDLWVAGWHGATRNPALAWTETPPGERAVQRVKRAAEESFPDAPYPELNWPSVAGKDWLGRVWVFADNRVFHFDGKTWTEVPEFASSEHDIYFLRSDSKGRIWIGTSGAALFLFYRALKRTFNDEIGHSKSVIYTMDEAHDGTLYFGTQHGLCGLSGGD